MYLNFLEITETEQLNKYWLKTHHISNVFTVEYSIILDISLRKYIKMFWEESMFSSRSRKGEGGVGVGKGCWDYENEYATCVSFNSSNAKRLCMQLHNVLWQLECKVMPNKTKIGTIKGWISSHLSTFSYLISLNNRSV